MTAFCPSCGLDLRRDELIERDGFTFDPRGAAFFGGKALRLTRAEIGILQTLAKAEGRPVVAGAISGRVGNGGGGDSIRTIICKLRHRLADLAIPDPIESVWGRGYRWRP